MQTQLTSPGTEQTAPPAIAKEVPFGANEVRLNARQWFIALVVLGGISLLVPELWKRFERFDTGPDYRVPYELSKDYWLYQRWLGKASQPNRIFVLGDSVIWGEYVLPDGTLSHFLNRQAGVSTSTAKGPSAPPPANRFINAGVNGMFPLAEEGLIKYYSGRLRHQKVLLHCNPLWMTSPKADLSTDKEEQFNHSRLVPQFWPRIRCYRADANERLSACVERQAGFVQWVDHLQNAYFGQKSVLRWTLEDDGATPPHCPNAWRNPLSQITLHVPSAPPEDPQRGPASPRHKPWSANGTGTTRFDWVPLESSLQWRAFQRLVALLQNRGDDVLVVLGPFNAHMLAEDNRPAYEKLRQGVAAWLSKERIPHVIPETLPSELYADASHPLTHGYELLARRLFENDDFRRWVNQ